MQDTFEALIRSGASIDVAYAQLGLERYCCKQTVMSPIVLANSSQKQDKALIQGIKGATINPVKYAPSQNILRELGANPEEGLEPLLLPVGKATNVGFVNRLPTVKSKKSLQEEPYTGSGQLMVPEVNFNFPETMETSTTQYVDVGSGLKVPILSNRAFHAV